MITMREQQLPAEVTEVKDSAGLLLQECINEISRLNHLAPRGIRAFLFFIVVSVFVWGGGGFLPAPDTVTALLGKPPSPRIISIALLVYTFFAIILSLSRMTAGIEHRSSFSHVGFLTAFFLFYYFSTSLEENFWAVFGAGSTILGIESYRIWTYCAEGIAKNREDMEYVTRTGRPPPRE